MNLPGQFSEKERDIQNMFSAGAGKYDLLNRVISFGRDVSWRRFAVKKAVIGPNSRILDLACGTGDVAIEIARQTRQNSKILGVDFSKNMLDLAANKVRKRGLSRYIFFQKGRAEELPFSDEVFDAVFIAFGIRNVPNIKKGISEIYRVLKEGGKIVILEFTPPKKSFFSFLPWLYIRYILPEIGRIFSGSKDSYKYLPRSISNFYRPEEVKSMLTGIGFKEVKYYYLNFKLVVTYLGRK